MAAAATLACRVQFLDDTDPFNSTNFPEPSRPPLYTFRRDLPLATQLPGLHRLLRAPHKVGAPARPGRQGLFAKSGRLALAEPGVGWLAETAREGCRGSAGREMGARQRKGPGRVMRALHQLGCVGGIRGGCVKLQLVVQWHLHV